MARRRSRREPEGAPVPPALVALQERRQALEEQLAALDEEMANTVFKIVVENQDKITDYSKGLREALSPDGGFLASPFEKSEVVLGNWPCKGPLGLCVYDDNHDPAHDCCLFCGDPEERK